MADSPFIKDATDATFEQEVIRRSSQVPVVVDFWAPWCGPCRTLGPMLERLAVEHAGGFVLVKVNVDESPRIAQALRIQSIPFVMAFRDGKVASEFVGAQPEPAVRRFLASLLPDEGDRLAAEGSRLLSAGDAAGGEASLRAALEKRSDHPGAILALASLLADQGRTSDALDLLARASTDGPEGAQVSRLAAELRVRSESSGDEAALRDRVASSPGDLQAWVDLGRTLAAMGRYEDAFQAFLEVIRRDATFADGAARKAMIDLFTLLGRDDPLVDRYQRELSRLIYR